MDGVDHLPDPSARQRLDKWLFFTRMAKSRSIAQDWIGAGHVEVNGQVVRQSSHTLKGGDTVSVVVDRRHVVLVVLKAGERRGPYEEARLLYLDQSPPPEPRLSAFEQAQRAPGSGRPTKRERRQTDRLTNGD